MEALKKTKSDQVSDALLAVGMTKLGQAIP